MEQHWKRLESRLTEQQEKGAKIDSVAEVAAEGRRVPVDREEDKVVIRFSRGAWEVAPYQLALHRGMNKSRHSDKANAMTAARQGIHAAGLWVVGTRYGKNAAP